MNYKTSTIITKARNEILDLLSDAKEAKDSEAILMLSGLIDAIREDYAICIDCRDCFSFEKERPEFCPCCNDKRNEHETAMSATYKELNEHLNSMGWMK